MVIQKDIFPRIFESHSVTVLTWKRCPIASILKAEKINNCKFTACYSFALTDKSAMSFQQSKVSLSKASRTLWLLSLLGYFAIILHHFQTCGMIVCSS